MRRRIRLERRRAWNGFDPITALACLFEDGGNPLLPRVPDVIVGGLEGPFFGTRNDCLADNRVVGLPLLFPWEIAIPTLP